MFRNYIKIAFRNISKRKLYSFINAFGLSIGIAFCILIYLFINDEKSFDQFHTNKEQIYRIHCTNFDEDKFKKGEKEVYSSHAYLPAKLLDVMRDEMAEVEHITRFSNWGEGIVRCNDKVFKERVAFADSGFFRMFSFEMISGDPARMFRNATDAVLTEEIAHKYFGDEDPVGKTFTFTVNEELSFTIAGVIKSPPANSSLQFQVLLPMTTRPNFARSHENWGNFSYPTFVQLRKGTNESTFKANLDSLTQKYMGDRLVKWRESNNVPPEFKVFEFNFMNMGEVHQATEVGWEKVSDPKYSWILGGIAALILLIACINYISLALTTSASRRIEIGIRKVIGAHRAQLITQLSMESVLLACASMLIGIGLAFLFLPAFNEFTGKAISFANVNPFQWIGVTLIITLVVGLLSGSYPSFFLSRFLPASILKGRFSSRVQAGFTKPLVVFQFFLSASLIICSVIMYRQMKFIATKELGFEKDQVIAVGTQAGYDEKSERAYEQFKNALATNTSVAGVAGTSSSFNQGWSRYGYKIGDENKQAYVYRVDADYIPLLGIKVVIGRNFDPAIASDTSAIVVNEALVKDMGWKEPLDEYLNFREDSTSLGAKVIGVVKDYHFTSLEQDIEPMFLSINAKDMGYVTTIMVKLKGKDLKSGVESVKKSWTSLFPDKPFEYTFVDEDVARQYESYNRWMNITALSTGFAIVIACLGLFGLAGINALNKTKEIGIRKVMGAELSNIFIMLNKQYVWLSLIAFALAAPVSWYVMQEWWLQSFKFKITIGWELFAVSMLVGLVVALLTVSYHGIKAAMVNPAETLKYE
ncbi:MAG TPA: ABC transporter permease [Chryseosolibacter sp.]